VDEGAAVRIAAIVPNWNGERWLAGCLGSLAAQERVPDEVIVVDNGSTDASLALLRADWPEARVIELGQNTGFSVAANRGVREASGAGAVALVNTDVELAPDWLGRMEAALESSPRSAAVACKMVDLADPGRLDDAGDVLRRDGVCEQRGRFRRDDGAFDEPGEVFGACAGAALYRRDAFCAIGGFDEHFFSYLEDVDLALCRPWPTMPGEGPRISFAPRSAIGWPATRCCSSSRPSRCAGAILCSTGSSPGHGTRRAGVHSGLTWAASPRLFPRCRPRSASAAG